MKKILTKKDKIRKLQRSIRKFGDSTGSKKATLAVIKAGK